MMKNYVLSYENYNMSYSYAKDVLNNIYKISFDEEIII